jgi:hypothetical protein
MTLGFTGTRKGMTAGQKTQLRDFFYAITLNGDDAAEYKHEFHHGCAVGADTEAAAAARRHKCIVFEHPIDARGPLERNRDIVAACDLLIAAPETDTEQLRSGTWATVRYARAAGKPVVMLSRGR